MPLAHIHEQIVFYNSFLKTELISPRRTSQALQTICTIWAVRYRIPLAVLGSNRHSTPFNIQDLFRSLLYFFFNYYYICYLYVPCLNTGNKQLSLRSDCLKKCMLTDFGTRNHLLRTLLLHMRVCVEEFFSLKVWIFMNNPTICLWNQNAKPWKKEFPWVEFHGNKNEAFCAVYRTHASVCDKSGRLFLSIDGSSSTSFQSSRLLGQPKL